MKREGGWVSGLVFEFKKVGGERREGNWASGVVLKVWGWGD